VPSSVAQPEWSAPKAKPRLALFLGFDPALFDGVASRLGEVESVRARTDDEAERATLSNNLGAILLGPDFRGQSFPKTLSLIETLDSERVGILYTGLPLAERPSFDPARIAHLEHRVPSPDRLAEIVTQAVDTAQALELEDVEQQTTLFRKEAIQAHEGDRDAYGDTLLDDPGWARWTLTILAVGLVLFLSALCFVRLPHYSEGPAILQAAGRAEATALETGVVDRILVSEGDLVAPDQLLISLYGPDQEAEVRRLEEEFLVLLRTRLLDPHTSDYEVLRSRTAFEVQKKRLTRHEVRAPLEGRVLSVLTSPGEFIEAGRPAVLIDTEPSELIVSTLLPGKDRPALEVGQTLLLELDGYLDIALRVEIDEVASDALSAESAEHALGRTLRDTIHVDGPVVLVRGTLDQTTIESHGEVYPLRGGMPGTARVSTHNEPLIFELIPGLERLFQHEGGHESGNANGHANGHNASEEESP